MNEPTVMHWVERYSCWGGGMDGKSPRWDRIFGHLTEEAARKNADRMRKEYNPHLRIVRVTEEVLP